MRRCIYPLLGAAVATVILAGCCRKVAAPVQTVTLERTDSARVTHRTITVIDTVTVTVEIPAQSAMRHTADSVSHLETDVALSDARLLSDGTLLHTIENKPQGQRAEVYVPRTSTTDTVTRERVREVPVEVQQPVEVERELTQWQSFRLDAFWWLVAALALCGGWIARKPILNFTQRYINPK